MRSHIFYTVKYNNISLSIMNSLRPEEHKKAIIFMARVKMQCFMAVNDLSQRACNFDTVMDSIERVR